MITKLRTTRTALPLAGFAALAVVYLLWARFVVIELWSFSPITVYGFPFRLGYEGYSRWDAAWYVDVARRGYYYDGPGLQSSVAYFPAYPLSVRYLGKIVTDLVQAGMLVTLAAGAAFVVGVHQWARRLFDERVATVTVAMVLLWPYAYYLFGVVYSDALFLALAALAFFALERRKPWVAALLGAAATATRPVGVALVLGLVVRSLELDGVLVASARRVRVDLRKLRITTIVPAGSVAGLAAFCAYLWYRFRDPFAFTQVGGAEGWNRSIGLRTIVKGSYVDIVRRGELTIDLLTLTVSGLLTFVALALIVRVLRRLGAGYAVYCLVVLLLPFVTSPEFRGMGRYVLAAFPCFAVTAEWLTARTQRRAVLVPLGVAGFLVLGLFSTLFIRGYYMA